MLNRILLSVALIIISKFTFSQNLYKHIFFRGAPGKIYELDNGNFLYCFGGGFSRINQAGNLYFSKYYSVPSFVVEDLLRINDNELLICGNEFDTCSAFPNGNFFEPAVFKSDSSGNILWSKYYKLNGACGARVFSSQLCQDKGILLLGGDASHPQYPWLSGFALKTDSIGGLLWSKYFYQNIGGVQFGIELDDKSVILGLNLDSSGAVLARLDSLGNILWSISYIRPRGYFHSVMYEQDGTILVTGNTDSLKVSLGEQYPPWFHPTLFLMKIDTMGQLMWAKEYDDNSGPSNYFALDRSSIIKLFDGSYMIYSSKYTDSLFHRILMMHIDMNGNILWNRSHGPSGFLNKCQYIIQTSDSGFLMSERTIGNYPNGWSGACEIIKTDSLGQSIGCFEDIENINVYPYFPVDSNIILQSIDGAIELIADIRDTTYGAISPYDECILLSDDHAFQINRSKEVIIYPNPTNGKFKIEIAEKLSHSENYVTIFNDQGKIVLEKTIYGEIDKELDLSNLPKGIYLIRTAFGEKISDNKVIIN